MSKIIYIHPAIRIYRVQVFEKLFHQLKVHFFWCGTPREQSHISHEIKTILQGTSIQYTQAREIHCLPFDNFSSELLKLPFRNYKIYIFSNVTSVPYLLLAPLLRLLGKRIILFDELWRYPKEVKKYKIIYPYVKFLVKYCLDGVVAAGSKAKEFYIDEFSFSPERIAIAYNTTVDAMENIQDSNIDAIVKKRIDKVTKQKRILYLGRVVKYKGLDVLINAMRYIESDYDLVVIGDGDFRGECKSLASKLELNDRVHFLPSCLSYEAFYYYKNCDIFVLPTRFSLDANVQLESWGFTINEAMALEIPVITTTAVGSSFDLIVDGETGGLAEAGDVSSLAKKINFILQNNQNNQIGKKGRAHLMKTCNYDDNLKAYMSVIGKVSNR